MTRPDRIEVYEDRHGEWRWRIVAPSGQVIGDSAKGYEKRDDAVSMARRLAAGQLELTP